jgi:virulence-associated protein VagC
MNPETGEVILSPKKNGWDEFFALPQPSAEELEGFLEDRDQGEWKERDLF